MNRFFKIYGILLLSGSLFSCGDMFTQRILIDITPSPEKLVLLTNFENRNSPVVLLSVSGNEFMDLYTYGGNYKPGPEAEVEVFEEGISVGKMTRDTLSIYVFADQFIPRAGKNYEIRVKSREFDEVWASGRIPATVALQAEVTGRTRKVRNWNAESEAHEVKLSFTDPSGEDNFYRLSFSQNTPVTIDSLGNLRGVQFYSDDLIFSSSSFFSGGSEPGALQYLSGDRVFTDDSFKGTTKDIYIYVHIGESSGSEKSTEISLSLEHLSKDTYEYEFTRRQAWRNEDNPFVQPVIIHNNIRGGGLGAFNTYSTDSKSVKLQQ